MKVFALKARTYLKLGFLNVCRVAIYRTLLHLGVHPVQRLRAKQINGALFSSPVLPPIDNLRPPQWRLKLFGHIELGELDNVPDWLNNYICDGKFPAASAPWWAIPDFDQDIGDIKGVWEMSRFQWILPLAQRWRQGDDRSGEILEQWLRNWIDVNPAFLGPNWKCGQEASIRLIHLVAASIILGQEKKLSSGYTNLLKNHLRRILPTISYAIAQDNNHGTSEAVGLFVGGAILTMNGDNSGQKYAIVGRKLLENRINKLIMSDGTFSQYSITYHRLMLDCVSFAEIVRRLAGLPPFTARLCKKIQLAISWLNEMTQKENGDAPVLGASDGAHILNLQQSDYRDFRPSIGIAIALFDVDKAEYTSEALNSLKWLNVPLPSVQKPLEHVGRAQKQVTEFRSGGFLIARVNKATAYLRYPEFQFRPSQNDLNHLDLWIEGINILRDGGTYSYNSGDKWGSYFSSIKAHNSVEFDNLEPMPSISRFLLGGWRKANEVSSVIADEGVYLSAFYKTFNGARHRRKIELYSNRLVVSDEVDGFKDSAVIRWQLMPTILTQISRGVFRFDRFRLSLTDSQKKPLSATLQEGYEARYYMQKQKIPVVHAKISQPGLYITELNW